MGNSENWGRVVGVRWGSAALSPASQEERTFYSARSADTNYSTFG